MFTLRNHSKRLKEVSKSLHINSHICHREGRVLDLTHCLLTRCFKLRRIKKVALVHSLSEPERSAVITSFLTVWGSVSTFCLQSRKRSYWFLCLWTGAVKMSCIYFEGTQKLLNSLQRNFPPNVSQQHMVFCCWNVGKRKPQLNRVVVEGLMNLYSFLKLKRDK